VADFSKYHNKPVGFMRNFVTSLVSTSSEGGLWFMQLVNEWLNY